MTNNDADELYHRSTAIQLIQTERGVEIWGLYGLGKVQMLGGIWTYGVYRNMGEYGYRWHTDIGGVWT